MTGPDHTEGGGGKAIRRLRIVYDAIHDASKGEYARAPHLRPCIRQLKKRGGMHGHRGGSSAHAYKINITLTFLKKT